MAVLKAEESRYRQQRVLVLLPDGFARSVHRLWWAKQQTLGEALAAYERPPASSFARDTFPFSKDTVAYVEFHYSDGHFTLRQPPDCWNALFPVGPPLNVVVVVRYGEIGTVRWLPCGDLVTDESDFIVAGERLVQTVKELET